MDPCRDQPADIPINYTGIEAELEADAKMDGTADFQFIAQIKTSKQDGVIMSYTKSATWGR